MSPASFQAFASLLKRGSGLIVGPEKQYLLEARLGPIMTRLGLKGFPILNPDFDRAAARTTGAQS